MLNFVDMETRRLNQIVTEGANTRIDDRQFLELELAKFLGAPHRKCMLEADAYYDYEQSILRKKRMVIADNGDLVEDKQLPNNKFQDNQYAKMVDQKVNYLLSKPLTFDSDNKAYTDALKTIFDKKFHRTLKNLGKDAYNGGIAWLYPYYDENGEFKIKRFRPWEVLPFWKDNDHEELEFGVRVYDVLTYEGIEEKIKTYVEVYDTQGIHKFTYEGNILIPDYQTYTFCFW